MTLETLNTLRIANGKRPLKSWKESKAKLAIAIQAEEGTKNKADLASSIKEELAVDPTPTPAPSKPAKLKPSDAKTFTIASLAADLGKSPKVIRAKARLNADKLPQAVAKHTYAIKHYDEVKKVLG